MKNIETVMFPLLFALCTCGLSVFEYPKGQPRLFFTILYISISWLLYIYFVVETKLFLENHSVHLPTIAYVNIIVASIFALFSIRYDKRFKSCLKKLDIVNDTLEKLGTLKNYTQLRARIICVVLGWILIIILTDIIDSLWLSAHVSHYYGKWLPYFLNYAIHITTLYEMTFITMLRYIESLYEQVSQYIQRLAEQKRRKARLIRTTNASSSLVLRRLIRRTDTTKSNQLLYILMHIYFELSSISRELNKIFGLQIMVQIATYHMCAVHYILWFYRLVVLVRSNSTYVSTIRVICFFLWSVRCMLCIFIFNYICEGISAKASRTEAILNRLANVTFNEEAQKNIVQFLLEILRKPLKITGYGFYDFGHKLIHKVRSFVQKRYKTDLNLNAESCNYFARLLNSKRGELYEQFFAVY